MCFFCHTRGFNVTAEQHLDRECVDPQNHMSCVPYSERDKTSKAPMLCKFCVQLLEECSCDGFHMKRYNQGVPLLPTKNIAGEYEFSRPGCSSKSSRFRLRSQ